MSRVNREGKQFTENNLEKKDKTKWQKKDEGNYWEEKKWNKKMEEKTYLQPHE